MPVKPGEPPRPPAPEADVFLPAGSRPMSIDGDDSIRLDTSKAPWMDYAHRELHKDVKELRDDSSFQRLWYLALAEAKRETQVLAKQVPALRYTLLGKGGKTPDLLEKAILKADKAQGEALASRNPEIVKYFEDLMTDPEFDPKGRSFRMSPVYGGGRPGWQITAWCAAFVNWCLHSAGVPHLGYSTAKSWLTFGTPLPTPVYGCITIVPPSKSTGSSTGHVAFYERTQGASVILIGGNQHDQVRESPFKRVLGYRWPTADNYSIPETGFTRKI